MLDVPVSYFFDEMPSDALSGRPMSGRGRKGFGEVGTAFEQEKDPPIKRETVELVRAYYNIHEGRVLKRIFEMVNAVGAASHAEVLGGRKQRKSCQSRLKRFCSADTPIEFLTALERRRFPVDSDVQQRADSGAKTGLNRATLDAQKVRKINDFAISDPLATDQKVRSSNLFGRANLSKLVRFKLADVYGCPAVMHRENEQGDLPHARVARVKGGTAEILKESLVLLRHKFLR